MIRCAAAVALSLAMTVTPALAHPAPLGIGGFFGGLLHPLFVPAHLLAGLALGLLIGRQAAWTRLVAITFILGLAAGLGVMTLGVVPLLINEAVLAFAMIAGLLVAADRSTPEVAGCILAVLAGFCIALDSPPDAVTLSEANLMLLGTGISAALLLIAAAAIAARLILGWPRVVARILGSWIAASAILVLALRFVR